MNFLDQEIYAQTDEFGKGLEQPGFFFGNNTNNKYLSSEAHSFQTLPPNSTDFGGSIYRLNSGFNFATDNEPPQLTEPLLLKFPTDDLSENGVEPLRFEKSEVIPSPSSEFLLTNTQIDNNLYNVYPDGVRKATSISSHDIRAQKEMEQQQLLLNDLDKQIRDLENTGGIPASDLNKLRDRRDELERKIDPTKALIDSISDLGKRLESNLLGKVGQPMAGVKARDGTPIITESLASIIAEESRLIREIELRNIDESVKGSTDTMIKLFETIASGDSFQDEKRVLEKLKEITNDRARKITAGGAFVPDDVILEVVGLVKDSPFPTEEAVELMNEITLIARNETLIGNILDDIEDTSKNSDFVTSIRNTVNEVPSDMQDDYRWAIASLLAVEGLPNVPEVMMDLKDALDNSIENKSPFMKTEGDVERFIDLMENFYGFTEEETGDEAGDETEDEAGDETEDEAEKKPTKKKKPLKQAPTDVMKMIAEMSGSDVFNTATIKDKINKKNKTLSSSEMGDLLLSASKGIDPLHKKIGKKIAVINKKGDKKLFNAEETLANALKLVEDLNSSFKAGRGEGKLKWTTILVAGLTPLFPKGVSEEFIRTISEKSIRTQDNVKSVITRAYRKYKEDGLRGEELEKTILVKGAGKSPSKSKDTPKKERSKST